ncbi:conjugal transfer protein TraG N-terminal domain-containing protein [Vibrio metoecus]|nr:hypothetical protein [Vibrio cholerae]
MNIVTNEISGIFMLPLASSLSNLNWQVMNELGIVFIPFIYSIVRCFFEARSQGLDEGSPAVLAIKLFEKAFWGYIIVIFLVATPYQSPLKVHHKQYSCSDNPSLISNQFIGANAATTTALAALGADTTISPPFWYGLLHQVSVGINETATSKLSCKKGLTALEVVDTLKKQIPESESVFRSIHSFHKDCYAVAQTALHSAMAKSEPLLHSTNSRSQWSFYPPAYAVGGGLMLSAYDGSYIKGKVLDEISMKVPDTWFDASQKGRTMACNTLAESLYKKIEADLSGGGAFQQDLKKLMDFARMTNPKVSEAEIVHDMVIRVYEGSLSGSASKDTQWKQASFVGGFDLGFLTPQLYESLSKNPNYLEDSFSDGNSSTLMQAFSSTMVTLGGMVTSLVEAPKSHAVSLLLPMIVTILQTILLIALPLLVVLSGYSFVFIFNWSLFYFAITLTPFWLNVGQQIETLLLSLINYSDSLASHALNVYEGSDRDMYLVTSIASTFVYMTPVVWVMLVQIIGNISASTFMNAVSSGAVVGQTGAEKGIGAMSDAGKLIVDKAVDTFRKAKPGDTGLGIPTNMDFGAHQSSNLKGIDNTIKQ